MAEPNILDYASVQQQPLRLTPDLRIRLSLMMFLQYAIWGAWWSVLGKYMVTQGFGGLDLARAYATTAIASIISPLIFGQIADRWVPTHTCWRCCTLRGRRHWFWCPRPSVRAVLRARTGVGAAVHAHAFIDECAGLPPHPRCCAELPERPRLRQHRLDGGRSVRRLGAEEVVEPADHAGRHPESGDGALLPAAATYAAQGQVRPGAAVREGPGLAERPAVLLVRSCVLLDRYAAGGVLHLHGYYLGARREISPAPPTR